MFGILTTPLKVLFLALALYGISFIPVQGRPLWKHIEISALRGWETGVEFFIDQVGEVKRSLKTWIKKRPLAGKKKKGSPREQFTDSEEKELEKVLPNK